MLGKISDIELAFAQHWDAPLDGWRLTRRYIETLIEKGVWGLAVREASQARPYCLDVASFERVGVPVEHEEQHCLVIPREYWARDWKDWEQPSPALVHCHVHSHFSFDGLNSEIELCERARRLGMKALALTDHGDVFGWHRFVRAATKAGIKPILGVEAYMVDDRMSKSERKRYHLILLAMNTQGYHNILKIVSRGNTEGYYYRPRIDWQLLREHSEGVICTTACSYGMVAQAIESGDKKRAAEVGLRLKEIFGDRLYVEMQPTYSEEFTFWRTHAATMVKFAAYLSAPLVVVTDAHYCNPYDQDPHSVLIAASQAAQGKGTIDDGAGFSGGPFMLRSQEDMRAACVERFVGVDEATIDEMIANTERLADRVEAYEIDRSPKLPRPHREQSLRDLVHDKFDPEGDQIYIDRLNRELDVIEKLQFEEYFFILYELSQWAEQQDIAKGPGRGSACGSLVAYALGITDVDPIEHDLIFERFLNEGRKSAPDVDLDFDARHQDTVIAYLRERYNVARITTYLSLGSKSAVKDSARALGIPFEKANAISALVPERSSVAGKPMTLPEAIGKAPERFRKAVVDNPRLFEIAMAVEGKIKTKGQHPGGVVILDGDLTDHAALCLTEGSKGDLKLQLDVTDVDHLGLLKYDILSSKTVTTLKLACDALGKSWRWLRDCVPLDDPEVFRRFSEGECEDIFQFNSDMMRELLKRVRPTSFEDLTACTALVRPGASTFIEQFALGTYEPILPQMKPALASTRNVILYQEQVMRLSHELAGFTLVEAEDLRKAIGKKDAELMQRTRARFVAGCEKQGTPAVDAERLFQIIERAQQYLFNKSHAVAYTLVSYWSMWLKVHHPVEYFCGELTARVDSSDYVSIYIAEAKKAGVRILPPSVERSKWGFTIEGDAIRCGLGLVKQLGERSMATIEKKRPFTSIEDFMKKTKVNAGATANMVRAGAFDAFGTRKGLVGLKSPGMLFDVEEWDLLTKGREEAQALGFWLTVDPFEVFAERFKASGCMSPKLIRRTPPRAAVIVGGMVEKVTSSRTSIGEIGNIDLFHPEGSLRVTLWPNTWAHYKGEFSAGEMVVALGQKGSSEDQVTIDRERGGQMKEV